MNDDDLIPPSDELDLAMEHILDLIEIRWRTEWEGSDEQVA